jgi:hypothetical protein
MNQIQLSAIKPFLSSVYLNPTQISRSLSTRIIIGNRNKQQQQQRSKEVEIKNELF